MQIQKITLMKFKKSKKYISLQIKKKFKQMVDHPKKNLFWKQRS